MNISCVNLGSIERIALGQGLCFVVGNEEIAVFRTRGGQFFAVANRCPHRQGPLAEGVIGDSKVVCPLHGHKFDLTTGKGSEAHECVKSYRVWQDNNQIILEYSAKDSVDKVCAAH